MGNKLISCCPLFMRKLISIFEQRFELLHNRTISFVNQIPIGSLFLQPNSTAGNFGGYSPGELILRSAAAVEQTFGGLTVRLWDDPFEWTLPEELSTIEKIFEYFDEVKKTRNNGFALLVSDDDLFKEISAPQKMTSIADLLLDSIIRAETCFQQAESSLDAVRSQ